MKSEHKKPLSVSTMPWLPVDVMVDILCRLPVKSLLRFRCVSKQFRSIVDGPDFVKRHLQNRSLHHHHHHHQSQRLIVYGKTSKLVFVDLDLNSIDNHDHNAFKLDISFENWSHKLDVNVIGSCNGLLALSNRFKNTSIALWNISTKKHQILPLLNSSSIYYNYVDGFGYDAASDDYKVVRIQNPVEINNAVTEVIVYSLNANCWRRIDGFPPYSSYYDFGMAVLVEGTLNWVVQVDVEKDTMKELIVSFDLKSEKFFEVSPPDTIVKAEKHEIVMCLTVLGGCLCLYYDYAFQNQRGFDIWVMKEYGVKESWTKLYSFLNEELLRSPYVSLFTKAMVYSMRGDSLFIFQEMGGVLRHDLEKEKVESVEINGLPRYISSVTVYVDSLVSPNITK